MQASLALILPSLVTRETSVHTLPLELPLDWRRGLFFTPEKEFLIDNLLVRIPYIIFMMSGPASRHGSLNSLSPDLQSLSTL